MASDKKSLEREQKRLTSIIKQWNDSRLDLFAISLPDENLDCHGVMRFYHKDTSNNGKYATKCIRVSSNSSTTDVVEMLSTKFRPDMRMLTKPKYVINEVHVDGEMRELKDKEKPLLVQLSWVKDDREGRFLLHNLDDKAPVRLMEQFVGPNNEDSSFKLTRNLTKKEKKQKKKQEKALKKNSNSTEDGSDVKQEEIYTVKQLYSQVPESTFTRTVSNPEAVMKKRREQKLQKRGANIMKVYGDRINPEIPYKSLLLLPTDNVTTVIRDALDKYGLGKEKTNEYTLIQVVLPPDSKPDEMVTGGWGIETVLKDPKCPLDIEQNWKPHEGTLVFQLRHTAIDSQHSKKGASPPSSNVSASEKSRDNSDKRKTRNDDTKSSPDVYRNGNMSTKDSGGKLLELLNSSDQVKEHILSANVTEIGSDRRKASYSPFIELRRNDIQPSHCVVTNMDGVVTVTPQNRSEIFVEGKRIEETVMLSHGSVVRLGKTKDLVYCEPGGKISVLQIRKKLQAYAQHRSSTQERQPRPVNSQQQHRMPDKRQKAASLPRELDNDSAYRQSPASMRGAPSSTSSTQSKQSSSAGYNQPQRNTQMYQPPHETAVLPATIQLRNGSEETFLMEVVSRPGANMHFKLSPAYAVYLSLRDIVEVTPKKSLEPVLIEYLCTTTDLLDQTIQLHSRVPPELAFWMANASELLNFVRHDRDVSPCTSEAQDTLAKTVQLAFRHLVQCMQRELLQLMPAFLSPSDEDLPGGSESRGRNEQSDQPTMYNVLHMLSSAMSLLRRCRVNAALTIQLFSQLFHFINMWIFNEVITKPERGLCCRSWGIKLRARLARVEAWAEKQGLELAADCHLARVTQAMHLLQAPKRSPENIAAISGTCFKLNSLQLRVLLSQYIPSERDGESEIPNELIDKVVQVARNTADALTRSDGREVQLEEDPDLQLPFLLPEDGYSCDVVQSVPSGLTEFARSFVAENICAYHVNPEASGSWTVHFLGEEPQEPAAATSGPITSPSHLPPLVLEQPEMATVTFNKQGGGLGLSIVAARGPRQMSTGIYIRAVVKGGAADRDGRLQAGDQLVNVDGHSLVGLSQEKAAEIMTKTGQVVTLTVAKKAALFHGLGALLEPSPQQEHAPVTHRRPGGPHQQQPRPKSDGFALHQQGYQPNENAYVNQGKQSHQPSNQNKPTSQYSNRRKSPINKSTTQLNEEREPRLPGGRSSNQAPRPAMSMGNLQNSENGNSKSRALSEWQKTWEAKMAHSTYQRNRAKSSSTAALTTPASAESWNTKGNQHNRRKQVESLFTGHVSPRQHDQHPPPKSAVEDLAKNRAGVTQHHSLDNPNYEELPPPPTPPPESPMTSKSPESQSSKTNSPRDYYAHRSPKMENRVASPKSSHTMGRYVDPRPANPSPKSSPVPKTDKSKSSTLPRHFKSGPAWDADSRQREVQEQLNALRDREIDDLSARIDSLSTLEKSKLNNLLKEREFQRRVEEENRRMFSDEDISDEGYEVPDRPDRDRLIQLQDDHAGHFDARRDQEEEMRREEERERKRQLEREREEEKERERQLRERLDRERRFEEEESLREQEEMRRLEEEKFRREEERRMYEERMKREAELRRMEEERMRREEEMLKRQEMERARRIEENRKAEEERLRREKEEQDIQRREWLAEERERRAREERQRTLQQEWEQREKEEESQRLEAESRERSLSEIQMEREARRRALRFENEQKRRRERRMRPSEEDEKEEAERELLEKQLSRGKPSNFPKFSRPSAYGPASVYAGRHTSTSGSGYQPPVANKPKMRPKVDRKARPVSDGYFLGKTEHLPMEEDIGNTPNSTSTFDVSSSLATSPTRTQHNPVNYVTSRTTPRVIGTQERYRDPRDKREAAIKREQSLKRRQQEPSFLTFKDRQRLFSVGQDSPINKPKASKKLLEIESTLRRSQMS